MRSIYLPCSYLLSSWAHTHSISAPLTELSSQQDDLNNSINGSFGARFNPASRLVFNFVSVSDTSTARATGVVGHLLLNALLELWRGGRPNDESKIQEFKDPAIRILSLEVQLNDQAFVSSLPWILLSYISLLIRSSSPSTIVWTIGDTNAIEAIGNVNYGLLKIARDQLPQTSYNGTGDARFLNSTSTISNLEARDLSIENLGRSWLVDIQDQNGIKLRIDFTYTDEVVSAVSIIGLAHVYLFERFWHHEPNYSLFRATSSASGAEYGPDRSGARLDLVYVAKNVDLVRKRTSVKCNWVASALIAVMARPLEYSKERGWRATVSAVQVAPGAEVLQQVFLRISSSHELSSGSEIVAST